MPVFSPEKIEAAYSDCRRRKRGTTNALRFELNRGRNLLELEEELNTGSYRPTRSVCFINTRPKPREIFAADFRDRVVHHLFVREIERYWEKVFIHDSYACRPGKGTHAAVDRLGHFIRSITAGGRYRAWFLQIDIRNFFMSIDRRLLFRMIEHGLRQHYGVPTTKLALFCPMPDNYQAMRKLAETLIFHDVTECFIRKSPAEMWGLVPGHKTLFNCPPYKGLPIGNLTSQFFGNVYLNTLDQFVKHDLKVRYYIRYVDDAIMLSRDKRELEAWREAIVSFIGKQLDLELNSAATQLKPVSCGINFLGYVIHPTHRLARRRVVRSFEARLGDYRDILVVQGEDDGATSYDFNPSVLEKLLATLNSYLAHMAKSSSRGLLVSILEKHMWLTNYIKLSEFKAVRAWKPPRDFSRLALQVNWFQRNWPDAMVFFQLGRYYELFGKDALWAGEHLGLRMLEPRFRQTARGGVPGARLDAYVESALRSGRRVLLVRQSGYPLYHLSERLPHKLWIPDNLSASTCRIQGWNAIKKGACREIHQ